MVESPLTSVKDNFGSTFQKILPFLKAPKAAILSTVTVTSTLVISAGLIVISETCPILIPLYIRGVFPTAIPEPLLKVIMISLPLAS